MPYSLSICIPTYNRIASLKPLLEQICSMVKSQCGLDQVEICVSDNGSDDGTWALLENLAASFSFLSIRRNEENQGFGRNFWSVAKMAKGNHIYFTGDDDAFLDHALAMLLKHAELGAGLVLLNSHPTAHLLNNPFAADEVVPVKSLEDYLTKTGIFHGSFIGNLLFSREVFERHSNIGDAVHLSAYPQLYPVFRALHEDTCFFINSSITQPDDSVRVWGKMQPVYTAVDVALIVKQEVLPYVEMKAGKALMRRLGRSLPRAFLRAWTRQVSLDPDNPYQSLCWDNLSKIYS